MFDDFAGISDNISRWLNEKASIDDDFTSLLKGQIETAKGQTQFAKGQTQSAKGQIQKTRPSFRKTPPFTYTALPFYKLIIKKF